MTWGRATKPHIFVDIAGDEHSDVDTSEEKLRLLFHVLRSNIYARRSVDQSLLESGSRTGQFLELLFDGPLRLSHDVTSVVVRQRI